MGHITKAGVIENQPSPQSYLFEHKFQWQHIYQVSYTVKQLTLIFTIKRATQGRCPPSAAKNSGVFLSTSTSEQ